MVEDLVLTGWCLAGSTAAVPLQKQEAARDKFSNSSQYIKHPAYINKIRNANMT
jgi:hypothetical protein